MDVLRDLWIFNFFRRISLTGVCQALTVCPSQTLLIDQCSSPLSFDPYPTNSELQAAILNGSEMAQELKPICCLLRQWRKITFILVKDIQLKEKRDGGPWQVAERNPITVVESIEGRGSGYNGDTWGQEWFASNVAHVLFILCPQECVAVHPGSILSSKWYNKDGFPSGKKMP